MRKIISRAARAIAAQGKRFSDWLCDTDPAKTQMLMRVFGVLLVMFGILLIAYALTLPVMVLAFFRVIYTILATSMIILGGLLWLPIKNGCKGANH